MPPIAAEILRPESAAPREWTPRIWLGCGFAGWVRLLWRNRCAVHWSCWHIAAIDSFASLVHLVLGAAERLIHGRRIARTPIREAPIFILGHWRTGTTFLHELLIRDPRHSYPNTYACLVPNHFLLSERWFRPLFAWAMPSRRPMDNMPAGWDRPQEDEFALCMLGQPSPYLTIAFPNRPPQDPEYLDLRGLSPPAGESWKRTFVRFLKKLTCRDPRRLVLKSPPHSCRIPVLLDLFPDARFVHIVRDPYVVFPSTVHLWQSLYRAHGLQRPTFAGLQEHVFETFLRLYERIDQDRRLIPPGQFFELHYEGLIRDPLGQMQQLYEHLGLGEFDQVRPRLEEYLAGSAEYQPNQYRLPPALQNEITHRWGPVIRRYGYPLREAAEPSDGRPTCTAESADRETVVDDRSR